MSVIPQLNKIFTLQSQKKEKEADIKQQKYYEEIKSCDVTQRERERDWGRNRVSVGN